MNPSPQRKHKFLTPLMVMASLLILVGMIEEFLFKKGSENKHQKQSENYRNAIESTLPPLIRKTQISALEGNLRSLDIGVKRFLYNLNPISEYLEIAVIDTIHGDIASNLATDYTESRELGEKLIRANQQIVPMRVEVKSLDYDAPQLVAEVYILEKLYKHNYFNPRVLFLISLLSLIYVLYNRENIKTDNQLLETENKLLETERENITRTNQLLETENKLLATENELFRISTFNQVFDQVIDEQSSAVIGNQLQILNQMINSILSRLENDARNIAHDLRKAPCLANPDLVQEKIRRLENTQNSNIEINEITTLLGKIHNSVQTIRYVIDELPEVTSTQGQTINIITEIEKLLQALPPSVQEIPNLEIKLNYQDNPIQIKANAYHFKSIIRNALYNSSGAIQDYIIDHDPENYHPEILINCEQDDQEVKVIIQDNGPGIPPDLVSRLYQNTDRLNQSAGNLRGNGSIIVFAYLTLHQGKAIVENCPTGGAKVVFIFPKYVPIT